MIASNLPSVTTCNLTSKYYVHILHDTCREYKMYTWYLVHGHRGTVYGANVSNVAGVKE